MSYRDLLGLLLPPVSYDTTGARLDGVLTAEANALEEAEESARAVAIAIIPGPAALFPEWERLLDITPPIGADDESRLRAIIMRIRATGGLSIPYFLDLASTLGYDVDIQEPQPFLAGESDAGDVLYVPEIIWCWIVVVHGHSGGLAQDFFHAGESITDGVLRLFGDPVIEGVINEMKPAWTLAWFKYPDATPD